MQRRPEPELMTDPAKAAAYAAADFSSAHDHFIELIAQEFGHDLYGPALDLGCGPGDIAIRFARAYPHCHVDGIDGAAAMLAAGQHSIANSGVADRIHLQLGYLPDAQAQRAQYPIIFSNSLLHHLADPMVLWHSIRRYAAPGAKIAIMDLLRPENKAHAAELVAKYAQGEAEVLRQDFYHSLLAAYRIEEIETQLTAAGLSQLQVRVSSDRHCFIVGQV